MANYQKFSENIAFLGRHVNHDPASKAYGFDATGVAVKSIRHQRNIPVLNQGNLGSCTGNAMTGLLGTGAFFPVLPAQTLSTTDPAFNEQIAINLYSKATQLDGYKGQYPPTDTGSDGLSVAKAAQKNGWISGYQHTFDFNTFLAAIATQPVIVGIDWYSSFETPAADGQIKLESQAFVEGGHEIVLDELDVENQRIWLTNSWGAMWGAQGRAYFSFADFEALLAADGDVVVPVPLNLNPPTPGPVTPTPTPVVPTPVPPIPTPTPITPSADDVALWADIQKWAKAKGLI